MDWIEFTLAMLVFLASHRVPAALGLRQALVLRLGMAGYVTVFSLVSLGLFWWLIVAAGRAPFVPIWDQAPWHRWAVNLVVPGAILLATLGIGAPNPFAFEGRALGFDPARPGIAGLTRQPLLWALALWAGAHLLANGDLAHLLLFGTFLAMALAGLPLAERRKRRALGNAKWHRLVAQTALVPFGALLVGRWHPQAAPPWRRMMLAVGIWALLWHLHLPVIGVTPAP